MFLWKFNEGFVVIAVFILLSSYFAVITLLAIVRAIKRSDRFKRILGLPVVKLNKYYMYFIGN